MKRGGPKRDWTDARAKVEREGGCRVCGESWQVEAAHVTGREHDWLKPCRTCYGEVSPMGWCLDCSRRAKVELHVHPDSIVPLCRKHHREYDAHELDLLPYLSLTEQLRAVADAEGIENARVRTCPSQYRQAVA